MPTLTPAQSLYFRDQFRRARAVALGDAEAWHGVVVAVEQLAVIIAPGSRSLHQAAPHVGKIASPSPLASDIPTTFRDLHTPFGDLYHLVRAARNNALHEGAFARRLTRHAIELCLILEHALTPMSNRVSDYMVRDPVVAELWHPMSFVRQTMLINAFSYLPVPPPVGGSGWRLLSDLVVARYVREAGEGKEKARLATTLADAIATGHLATYPARTCLPDASITAILAQVTDEQPTLVIGPEPTGLLGILTPFDLL